MIRGYVQSNLAVDAIFCYKMMLKDGLIKNNYTFTPLIKACSMVVHESRYMGILVHGHVVRLGFCREQFIASALIEFYSLNLDMGKARVLFDEMPERDVNILGSVMLSLFKKMEEVNVKPNESVFVSALTACAHTGALAQGLWLHSYARRCKFDSNAILATALVDMYSKCGSVELALSVFEGISDKGSRAWNAIISGVAMNGEALKSLQSFDEMVLSGIQPTDVTFVSVLTACTHANFVDRGLSLFKIMGSIYGVEPNIEHYACVVDLLARSGRLDEAEKFVEEKMGNIGEGDANVWGALLAACRTHGKVDIGKRVWRKLANEGVPDYGTHVLSYNMYKEAGLEAEAESVRRMIEERRMKKIPGCSSIEVNGIVEEFFAGDLLHPKAQELFKVLDSLLRVSDVSCSIKL
ncbi:Hypothetical predicted protein [Olea europaea subsp. europaea]|uniref:Pentatricopeptide repeat-containing protein n=1 Tax=Olea europaea subsp. europaea TaxID=158383 RepID=A0A8S0R6Z5_OLEEU|nr:Hypothetical predicted protein [Olea europaea subsp. europaea]